MSYLAHRRKAFRASAYTDDPGTYGLSFDGANDYLDCGSDTSIDNIFDGGGTLAIRMNPASDGENDLGRIVGKYAGGSGWQFTVREESAGFVKLRLYQEFSTADGEWRTSSAVLPINTWSTVALVYDSSSDANVPKMYIDGVEQTLTENLTPSGTYASDAALDMLFCESNTSGGTRAFDGDFDWIRIYDKELSQAELQDISAMSANLVANWELEENTGTTAGAGQSSPTNDGTIIGATWTTV